VNKRSKTKRAKKGTKKSEPVRTLLDAFIFDSIEEYTPPERKGTPKGEEIGYNIQKFSALFNLLRNWPLKKVAAAAGVSYGVLRKWRSEEAFKKMYQDVQHTFALRFCDCIVDLCNKTPKTKKAFIDLENDPRFIDTDSYRESLRKFIEDAFRKIYLKGGGIESRNIRAFFTAIRVLYPDDPKKISLSYDVRSIDSDNKKRIMVLDAISSFFDCKSPTAEDREQAIKNIELLGWLLGTPKPQGLVEPMETDPRRGNIRVTVAK